jgi:hypothetical protein
MTTKNGMNKRSCGSEVAQRGKKGKEKGAMGKSDLEGTRTLLWANFEFLDVHDGTRLKVKRACLYMRSALGLEANEIWETLVEEHVGQVGVGTRDATCAWK